MNQDRLNAPRFGEARQQPLRFAVALVRLPGLAGSGEGGSQVLRELVEDVNHGGMLPQVPRAVDGQAREVCP